MEEPIERPVLITKTVRDKNNRQRGLFKCRCGKEFEALITSVKTGNTKSCGCGRIVPYEIKAKRHTKHGMTKTPEYKAWRGMKERCYDLANDSYDRYGGRGIRVCDRWLESFENFFEDMGLRPSKDHSIDRINNNGDYCKDNCIWSDRNTQCRNRRSSSLITYKGEIKTQIEWSEITGIDRSTIFRRIYRYGWSIERALTEPVRVR